MTRPPTPFSPHSRTTSPNNARPTVTTARSMEPGISPRLRCAFKPPTGSPLPVNRVDGPGEAAGEEIMDDELAGRITFARGDDCDRTRAEDVLDRTHGGGPLAFFDPFQVLRAGGEIHRHPDHPRVQQSVLLESG